ncbi:hypothetical protein M23134_04267 [Microscilla marina ATCC 23134]|uniref:Uncharacterized protein n=1 Tax=Microscilla marina ATCC 23134 TaxID=313606 RepID=A1ZEC7_MICM2|nr:hypothetical protein M23134_04267 [Microscilla marina ATCC 23134]
MSHVFNFLNLTFVLNNSCLLYYGCKVRGEWVDKKMLF